MKKVKITTKTPEVDCMRPALTPDAREQQLCSLAEKLAEKQLLDGTASSQVITHYLKLASSRERLEKEVLQNQVELLKKKVETLESAKDIKVLYAEAIDAMKTYSGEKVDEY